MWEIREGHEHDGYHKKHSRSGMHHEKTAEEEYECGYEDGYEAAMEEIERYRMGQRSKRY
jgi:hypothetical protein